MIGWFERLSAPRQTVMLRIMTVSVDYEMAPSLTRLIAAIEADDYDLASLELLNSPWARQVGDPAKVLIEAFLNGREPPATA